MSVFTEDLAGLPVFVWVALAIAGVVVWRKRQATKAANTPPPQIVPSSTYVPYGTFPGGAPDVSVIRAPNPLPPWPSLGGAPHLGPGVYAAGPNPFYPSAA